MTIIVSLGGLAIDNIMYSELLVSNNGLILSVFYVFTVLFFSIGVIFAFRAYHIGSPIIKIDGKNNGDKNKIQITDKKTKKVYARLDENWLVENSEEGLVFLQKNMIHFLGKNMSINQKYNTQKSNNLIYAYYITITAIISLLLLCVVIILNIYAIQII